MKVKIVDTEGFEDNTELSIEEALNIADERELNLVAFNENEVPVCKILDYQKYLYNLEKKARENKKKKQELKEVKFNPFIADHDLEIKAKTADRLMGEGDKVKITITYKGRSMSQIKDGIDILNKFDTLVTIKHKIDKVPAIDGNRVCMILSPVK
ncbi:MAG: translation initiation factor IF-3 [Lachnospiraceae bacterium]|nr:translation initiation factor IF-3 [Lachnospiraceae bacterium]